MEFKELQKKIIKNAISYNRKYHLKFDKDLALLKLYEEVGELTKAVLIHQRKCRLEKYVPAKISKRELAQELADVLGLVVINAYLYRVDLEKIINKKWINNE
ncbi:MAG: hypothetical protein M1338_05790 [Patescibacteria group bacterium]|nr:hypothetical protein [Patescibacteria group bacterium]